MFENLQMSLKEGNFYRIHTLTSGCQSLINRNKFPVHKYVIIHFIDIIYWKVYWE